MAESFLRNFREGDVALPPPPPVAPRQIAPVPAATSTGEFVQSERQKKTSPSKDIVVSARSLQSYQANRTQNAPHGQFRRKMHEAANWARHNKRKAAGLVGGTWIVGALLATNLPDIGDAALKVDACAEASACQAAFNILGTPDIESNIQLPDPQEPSRRLRPFAEYSIANISFEDPKNPKIPVSKWNILIGVDIAYDEDELSKYKDAYSQTSYNGPLYIHDAVKAGEQDMCLKDMQAIIEIAKRHSGKFLDKKNPYINPTIINNAESMYETQLGGGTRQDNPNKPNIIVVSGVILRDPGTNKKVLGAEDFNNISLQDKNPLYSKNIQPAQLVCKDLAASAGKTKGK